VFTHTHGVLIWPFLFEPGTVVLARQRTDRASRTRSVAEERSPKSSTDGDYDQMIVLISLKLLAPKVTSSVTGGKKLLMVQRVGM
jgi:hypothetical protein